jgi:type IV secretion system protein VirB6/type IV secretion system protein TrbL
LGGSRSKDSADSGGSSAAGEKANAAGGGVGGGGSEGAAAGKGSKSGKLGAAGAMAARAGKVAAGTAANLAVGSLDVARAKAEDLKASAVDRIAETTGGKIAAAIHARSAVEVAKFGDDSLSAASSDKAVDAASEIAAFRDRDTKTS